MSSSKNFYKVLGVEKNASQDEIKRAYRKLALQHHPDRNPSNPDAARRKMQAINEAYRVLSNTRDRFFHDAELRYREAARESSADKNQSQRQSQYNSAGPSSQKRYHTYTSRSSSQSSSSSQRSYQQQRSSQYGGRANTTRTASQQSRPTQQSSQSGGCINWRLIILYLVFQGALSLLTRFGDMPDQANDTDLRTTPPISASSTQFYDEFHQMLMLANESKVFLADSDMCRAKTKQETYVYSENQRSIVSKLEAGTALIVMPSTDVGWVRIWGGASRVYVRTDEVELMNCTESEIVMTSTPIFGSRTMRFVTAVPVTILPVIGQRCYVRNITGDELPVYAWLDTDAEIVGTISTNATFYVEFVRLGWFKVSGATMNQSDGGLVQGVALEVLHCK